jgi:hypothetical protein
MQPSLTMSLSHNGDREPADRGFLFFVPLPAMGGVGGGCKVKIDPLR